METDPEMPRLWPEVVEEEKRQMQREKQILEEKMTIAGQHSAPFVHGTCGFNAGMSSDPAKYD
jgi:hypothetical protein